MKRKTYFEEVKKIVNKGFADYQEKAKEYSKLKEEREAGHFSIDYLNDTILPKLQTLKSELNAIQENTKSEVRRLTEQQKEKLVNIDVLDPKELTDDIKLLQGGLILKERDIEGILSRNAGNRTMTQLAIRYADEHGMKGIIAPRSYVSGKDLIMSYDNIRNSVDMVIGWYDEGKAYKNMYDTVLGDTGCISDFCNTDSDI